MDAFSESIRHIWEAVTGVLAATVSYLFYKKKKKEEQLTDMCNTLNEQTTDITVLKVELRELKEDIHDLRVDVKELKEWLFNNKKR